MGPWLQPLHRPRRKVEHPDLMLASFLPYHYEFGRKLFTSFWFLKVLTHDSHFNYTLETHYNEKHRHRILCITHREAPYDYTDFISRLGKQKGPGNSRCQYDKRLDIIVVHQAGCTLLIFLCIIDGCLNMWCLGLSRRFSYRVALLTRHDSISLTTGAFRANKFAA